VAKNKRSSQNKTPPPVALSGVEFYFDKFAAAHQNRTNRLIYIIFIPLIVFGLFAICWSLKFPYIKLLGKYNQDFNWASFLLAFAVYYYIRMSPVLGYFMLFILLIFFYTITELAQWQSAGGPNVGIIGLVMYFISFVALFIGYNIEGKKLSWEYRIKNMLIAPAFLLHLVLKRFSVKY
jgi:uncharacterized membrane protein YGL010W